MKRNRKKTFRYRFNGHPYFDSRSIYSVEISDLESQIRKLEAKLIDPKDSDDRKWTARWLARYRLEMEKKLKALDLKQRKRNKHTQAN
jgi:hypothetical protein